MSDKKVGIFSALLFFGVAALFVPVTALQNSIAMTQEYYPEDKENQYYNQEYDPYKNKDKNAPIVNVEKNLFICNDAIDSPNFFECSTSAVPPFYPAGIDSQEYIPCDDELCPFIDESDFSAQIFKDVATVRELSPEGTPVNLDKFHYTVTEGAIDERITNDFCSAVGFDHFKTFDKVIDSTSAFYEICVNYVGDCEGTIYSGEVKTCTIENYIIFGEVIPLEPDGNIADTSSTQQTNNQAIQSQPNILRDILSDRTN
jgi:hypothetical protein